MNELLVFFVLYRNCFHIDVFLFLLKSKMKLKKKNLFCVFCFLTDDIGVVPPFDLFFAYEKFFIY